MEETKNVYKHESYGNLEISRTTGSTRTLYGSDLAHKNTIKLTISLSELTRKLNNDWYYPYERLIDIELSPVQFSEAITNMNSSGVPCTIRYYNGKQMEDCPYRDKNKIFKKEFSDTIQETNSIAKTLVKDLYQKFNEKKTFNKSDKEEILSMLNKLSQNLGSNMDFITECCHEQVEKTVLEAKGEIESYITNKINTLGLKALKDESEHLLDTNIDKEEK